MKSVTIAGGGLAGLSLGIGLRRHGVPVEVFEASTFPRHRVCGEFISGVSEETLEALGIQEDLSDAGELTGTAWYDHKGRVFSASLPSPARGISRFRLDDRLSIRLRELGGGFREGERFASERAGEDGVVNATGRALEKGSAWLGLKAHWLDFGLEEDLEMHLGDDGYIGLSRVEDGRVNVTGLFRRRPEVKAKGSDSLLAYISACGLDSLVSRLTAASLDPDSCVGVSSFGFGLKGRVGETGFRIGDQRAIIPPFTGNGMSMALQSAELALPHLLAFSKGLSSWEESLARYQEESERYFAGRMRAAKWVHPFIFSPFGQKIARGLGRSGLLPFSLLYRAVR
jgi:flavin-dependent dehydrogenase